MSLSVFTNDSKYISNSPNAFSYSNLVGLPTIPTALTNISSYINDKFFIKQNGGYDYINLNSINPSINYWTYSASNPNKVGAKISFINNNLTSDIVFSTASSSSYMAEGIIDDDTTVERMRITTNGNVGIGKSNPKTILDVNGTTTTTSLNVNGIINANNNNIILSSDIKINAQYGICFNGNDTNFMIYRPYGEWNAPFVPLNIQFYTGINLITGEDRYPVNINNNLTVGSTITTANEILSGSGFRAIISDISKNDISNNDISNNDTSKNKLDLSNNTYNIRTPYLYAQDTANLYGQWRIGDGVVGGWAGLHFAPNDMYLMMGNNNIANGVWAESGTNWMWYCDASLNFNIYKNLVNNMLITAASTQGTVIFTTDVWNTSVDNHFRHYFAAKGSSFFESFNGNFYFKSKDSKSDIMSLTNDGHLDVPSLITTPEAHASNFNCSTITSSDGLYAPILTWRVNTFSDHQQNQILDFNFEAGNPGTVSAIFNGGFQGICAPDEIIVWNFFRLIFRGVALNGDATHTFQILSQNNGNGWANLGIPFSTVSSQSKGYQTIISPWYPAISNTNPGYGIKVTSAGGFRIGNINFQFKN